jgi:hypothetical protein
MLNLVKSHGCVMFKLRFCMLLTTFFAWMCTPAFAQYSPLMSGSEAYVPPGRLFAIDLPTGWQPMVAPNNPDHVELIGVQRPGSPSFIFSKEDVHPSTSPKHYMLRNIEQRLSKLPLVKIQEYGNHPIGGLKGSWARGVYFFHGNVGFQRYFEEYYLIHANEAITIHFEVDAGAYAELSDEVKRMIKSIAPRPASRDARPFAPVRGRALEQIGF